MIRATFLLLIGLNITAFADESLPPPKDQEGFIAKAEMKNDEDLRAISVTFHGKQAKDVFNRLPKRTEVSYAGVPVSAPAYRAQTRNIRNEVYCTKYIVSPTDVRFECQVTSFAD